MNIREQMHELIDAHDDDDDALKPDLHAKIDRLDAAILPAALGT